MQARPRLLAALAALAALALAVAGCGGGGGSGSSGSSGQSGGTTSSSAIAAAATKTAAAGTAKVSFTASVQAPSAGSKSLGFSGRGALDYKNRRGELTYDIGQLLGAAGLSGGNGTADVIIDNLVVYMKFPLLTQQIPGGKEWIKLDLVKLGQAQGFNLGSLAQLSQSDPTQALLYLRAASSGVQVVGKEPVRGVETTHYRVKVDLTKVPDTAPPAQRAQLRESIQNLVKQTGTRFVPTEVWIDGNGLVRRERVTYAAAVPQGTSGGTQSAKTTVTMDFYDFGSPVTVTPPPASDVTDLAALLGQD